MSVAIRALIQLDWIELDWIGLDGVTKCMYVHMYVYICVRILLRSSIKCLPGDRAWWTDGWIDRSILFEKRLTCT